MKLTSLTVTAAEIEQAVERATKVHGNDWQAQCIEIALIPSVYAHWQALNDRDIQRLDGLPITINNRAHNLAIGAADRWHEYAGYALNRWNSRAMKGHGHGYRHSPGTTWDGMRRETVCQFLVHLLNLYQNVPSPHSLKAIADRGITFKE